MKGVFYVQEQGCRIAIPYFDLILLGKLLYLMVVRIT